MQSPILRTIKNLVMQRSPKPKEELVYYHITRKIGNVDVFWWPFVAFGQKCCDSEEAVTLFLLEKEKDPSNEFHLVRYVITDSNQITTTTIDLENEMKNNVHLFQ